MNAVENSAVRYLADGRICRLVSHIDRGRVVVELGRRYEEEDGNDSEVFFSGTEIVQAADVYEKPLVDAYAPEITRLEAEQRAANEKLIELRRQVTLTERRVEALKVYDPLKRIEDFLAGKITHFVEHRDDYHGIVVPKVLSLDEAHDGDEVKRRYCDGQRLLVLFGKKDRSMQWHLNRYSDGSGAGWRVAEPFCSADEANARARELVAQSFARIKDENLDYYGEKLLNSARACGAPIPEGFAERLRQNKRKGFVHMVEKAEKERSEWQARLEALDAQSQVHE